MPGFTTIKISAKLLSLLRQCQQPGESISDTIKALLDNHKIVERVAVPQKIEQEGTHGKG